jgi:hypothetical protein
MIRKFHPVSRCFYFNFALIKSATMEALILTGDKKSEMNLIGEIARKFGIKTRKLSIEDLEDLGLLKAIKDGETGEYVDTNQFLDSIRRK